VKKPPSFISSFLAKGHTNLSLTTKQYIMNFLQKNHEYHKDNKSFMSKTIKNASIVLCLLTLLFISCSSEGDSGTPPVLPTDTIELTLTTSKAAYQSANTGDWIQITEIEYNLLAIVLNNVSKIGTTDAQYNDDSTIFAVGSGAQGITMANDNGIIIPSNSYAFAFKYNVTDDNASSTRVKISSTSVTDNYSNLGNILPPHDTGDNYFVLKGSNSSTSNTGYLGVFCLEKMGFKELSSSTDYYFTLSDATKLNIKGNTNTAVILFQGLSTTEKQWD